MRWRRSTPCRSSSTAVSRRSRAAAAFAASLLFLSAAPLARGQAIELSMAPGGGAFTASLGFRWARTEEVIDSLRRGLESRITFTTRLYERRRPAFAFAGDRLVAERTVVRSAFWDFLERVFVLEEEGSGQKTYTDPAQLIRGFFSLEETFSLSLSDTVRRPLYVTARARFEPVRLMPPLTLVGLAGTAASVTTPWVRRDAP